MQNDDPTLPPEDPAVHSSPLGLPPVSRGLIDEVHGFHYDGASVDLFKLYLKNILLTILTLGIYRFWAKVAVQRFHYQHTEFFEGRFGYHATGKEKFIGFLKGMVVLLPLVGMCVGLYFFTRERMADEDAFVLSIYAFGFLFFFLRPLIIVGARRFNLARTSWNNLRFRFIGTVGQAYKLYMKDLFLIIFSFGIYYSWHLVKVHRFKVENTRFGGARFDFTGQGSDLFMLNLVGIFLSYITMGIYLPWYVASLFRFHATNTRLEGIPIDCSITGWKIMKLFLLSLVLIVCTVGIGFPWAIRLYKKTYTESLFFNGRINLAALQADFDKGASALVEGIGEAGEALAELGDLFG